MNPLLILLAIPLLGSMAVYLLGRIARRLGGEAAAGWTAGSASIVLILWAGWTLWRIRSGFGADGLMLANAGATGSPFSILLKADGLSIFMGGVILALSLAAAVFSLGYMSEDSGLDKYYPVLLLMIGSMLGLTVASDAFNLFIFFELMSVSSFVLVAFRKYSWEPIEAGFKYIILSAVGSFLLLLGIMLAFMYTGHLSLQGIAAGLASVPQEPKLVMLALIIAGLGVKSAIVPLHTWLPDAHSAAPSGISALLSGVVIQTSLFAMFRILLQGFTPLHLIVGQVFMLFGILTMTAGNITAIRQSDIKRMLAYSSVAQMGYILLGLGIGLYYRSEIGLNGGLFHIMTHAFMKGLAFMCAGAIIHAAGTREISDLRGIGWRMPITVGLFGLAGLSLAGVPPFSGFMSKLLIYEAGIKTGLTVGYMLSGIAVLNSIISLGYYLPALSAMFAKDGSPGAHKAHEASVPILIALGSLALITILLGVWPEAGLRLVYPAVKVILDSVGGIS